MAKKRPGTRRTFDPATRKRLLVVGRNQPDFWPNGSWAIRFGPVLKAADGLPEFEMTWCTEGTAPPALSPDDGLFHLWNLYRPAHAGLIAEYRRVLLQLLSRRPEGQYTDRQWRVLRRTPPTEQDMRGVVDGAMIWMYQRRMKGVAATEYEVQVEFDVYWDEHGVTVGVRETENGFEVVGG